jgi:DNA invertase Pin-like site-specific DNA recombinase
MHVALYARVSTSDQDADLQLVELRRYVAARGWAIVEEFVDQGVSGSLASRPALDRLRAAARRRDVDAVVVWRFDRFSRSITDLVASLEEFRTLGVAFVSIHEQIDTGSPTGRVVFAVVAAMAEFEREILRERVRAGMARARERGVRLGRPFKLDALEVLRLRRDGLSVRAIARSVGAPASTVADLLRRHVG